MESLDDQQTERNEVNAHLHIEKILCCANPKNPVLEVADGDNKVKPMESK